MDHLQKITFGSGKYILTSFSSLAIFGITLAITWSLPPMKLINYQLATAIFSAGFATMAGGYIMGKLMKSNHPIRHASLWGLMIGFTSLGYLLGIERIWFAGGIISGILSTVGSILSDKNIIRLKPG